MKLAKSLLGFGILAALAHGESKAADIETVVVTASALPGTAIDPDKIPANVQTFSSEDLSGFGSADVLGAMNRQGAGVSLVEAQNNPFQPNLFFRGFEASPLAGDPQGLAVYVDGVRFNQSFGDVVNWDLIPDVAIDRLTLEGSNPVFGLNALGGSVSLRMKSGFSWTGMQFEAFGGSFGRAEVTFQDGEDDGERSFYAAGTLTNDDGWRDHSPSHLARGFADFGWRTNEAELHLDVFGAATALTGNGAVPVQLLVVDRSAVFTFPDKTDNQYGLANLFGTLRLDEKLSLQGNLYVGHFRQRTFNGDASDASPCNHGELCLDDGTIVTDVNGDPIPDFLSGGTYAQLNRTATETTGFGGAIQMTRSADLFGHDNQLVAGFAYDGGRTSFGADSEIGAMSITRGFLGPGIVIDVANGEIAPVKVDSDNDYYGLYAADAFAVTDAVSLTLSARFNNAHISLADKLGSALNGAHDFRHVNPAAGITYRLSPETTLYAGYSEANRAPTPAEFSCASPSSPCSLTNFFVGDPALKQVVAHTLEAGLRGNRQIEDGALRWHAGIYRMVSADDILFASSPVVGRGFFRNVGETRRQGVEASLEWQEGPWSAGLDYAYTDATFETSLTLDSPDNPYADDNGQIHVRPGDEIPSVPHNTLKTLVTYRAGSTWEFAAAARYSDGAYLRGDESNLNPKTGAYVAIDASASYRLTHKLTVFADIDNLLDTKYATFGTFSPTSDVPIIQVPDASNPRSLSPATPFFISAGFRVRL